MYIKTITKRMPIITIDGNIGSGKSSILNYLHKYHKMSIDLEPVESWNSYLNKQYDDKQDIFKFQVRIWLDRCWIQEKTDKTVILMERSPLFIKKTFIESAATLGLITPQEYNILTDLHKKTDSLWSCNTYIYLRSSPENCMKRIKKRNRQCEKNITQEYVQLLHNKHEETYAQAVDAKMNIIYVDVDDKSVADIANEILQYIQYAAA
jgi:deoxyadenosine/deoxycytidine kinase